MSRIGKQPITLPPNVTVTVAESIVTVRGPKGELRQKLHPNVYVATDNVSVTVSVEKPDEKADRSLWGLFRMLIANMVTGVTEGFQKVLEVQGVGYRVAVHGRKVVLSLGFSHPVEYELPVGIEAKAEGPTLTISGLEKQVVGETAARIRSFRPPEPYKGKGIRYAGEQVRRKAGKVMKSAE